MFFVPSDYSRDETLETDEGLRARLYYVCGNEGRVAQEIEGSTAAYLDAIAERYGLKRRAS